MSVNLTAFATTVLAVLLSFPSAAVAASRDLVSLVDLADDSWLLVDAGGVSAPRGLLAYSSGWFEKDRGRFCLFGGGHWDYSGNDVWCFDTRTLRWQQMYPPDEHVEYDDNQGAYLNFDNKRYPGALFKPAGEPVANARPMSRHTYDQLEYMPGFGAVLWGGYSWGDGGQGWCMQCRDTWVFDSDTAHWKYLYRGNNSSPDHDAGVGTSAVASTDGLLYATAGRETWVFDPHDASWDRVSARGTPPGSIESTLEYDSKRHVMYLLGGSYPDNPDLYRFDIRKRRWQKMATTGERPALDAIWGPGLAYDSVNDVLLAYQSGNLWVLDPSTNRWSRAGRREGPTEESYVFGRLRFDDRLNGAWLHVHSDERHETWFYRFRRR